MPRRQLTLSLLVVLAAGLSLPGHAQTASCDDATRKQFDIDVTGGYTEAALEAKYGHCRYAHTEPSPCSDAADKVIAFTASNIFYERMNGCGYHPQSEVVGCDVEIRRPTGYGAFGPTPAGSFERIRVCLDCDRNGTWDFQTLGNVHVTDNISAVPVPSWYHLAFASTAGAPAACTANNGGQTNVRVILSWSAAPPACANAGFAQAMPIWGNRIDFTARRDP